MCKSVLCQDCSDLAPIGHVWDILWRNVRSRNHVRPYSQMFVALRREWRAIKQNEIRTIICLMFNRCTGCVRADGGHTSY